MFNYKFVKFKKVRHTKRCVHRIRNASNSIQRCGSAAVMPNRQPDDMASADSLLQTRQALRSAY